jgi:hypothetical protein
MIRERDWICSMAAELTQKISQTRKSKQKNTILILYHTYNTILPNIITIIKQLNRKLNYKDK